MLACSCACSVFIIVAQLMSRISSAVLVNNEGGIDRDAVDSLQPLLEAVVRGQCHVIESTPHTLPRIPFLWVMRDTPPEVLDRISPGVLAGKTLSG